MPLKLDVDAGVIAVEAGGRTIEVDVYAAHERYLVMWQRFNEACEKSQELALASEFLPVWAEKVTGIAGWSGRSALNLWEAVQAEIDAEKKDVPG